MLDELFTFFVNIGYDVTLDEDRLILDTLIVDENIKLIISIPEDYPYTFLNVSLVNKEHLKFSLPHMLVGDFLCLYDLDNDRHDYKHYLAEAEETVKRAIKLLSDSKNGLMDNEYQNEFYDLWTVREIVPIYSLLESYDYPCKLSIIKGNFKKKNNENALVIADKNISTQPLLNVVSNLSLENIDGFGDAVYMPIKKSKLTKPIEKISDLRKLVYKEKSFDFFLKEIIDKRIKIIVLGINNQKSSIPTLVALSLPKLVRPKGNIVNLKSYSSILGANDSGTLFRYGLTDLSQNRVFTRGGEGVKDSKIKTYLVGCGSLGSFLSKALCDTGKMKELIVQDNQLLRSENIGRHLCGIESILEPKTNAVARLINGHYPNLKISSVNHSFIQELLEKESTLTSEEYDLLIIATGDENIEEETINKIKSGLIKYPVIIAWVEPFLVAGHFIYINSPINDTTEKYIFDSENNIKLGIIENSESYTKAEVGCQSHYIPYSGFEMQIFSQIIADHIINKNLLRKKGNFHFTWFGKIKEARKNNISIKAQWRHKDDRELLINRIDE
ncbi:ThiF family adenylyltransferase [Lactococcus cremoris]|nr:ThiF family adenylyltransferase [Lactococcus cremoris]